MTKKINYKGIAIGVFFGLLIGGFILFLGYLALQEHNTRWKYLYSLRDECQEINNSFWYCENCDLITIKNYCVIDNVKYEIMIFKNITHYVSTERTIKQEGNLQ